MKIMILGGHGFIGSHVSNILVRRGHEVSIVDSYTNYNQIPEWEYNAILEQRIEHSLAPYKISYTIENETLIHNRIAFARPDVIIHLATYPNARYVQSNPTLAADNMVRATAYMLGVCKKYGVKRFVFSSSSLVYGDFDVADETMHTEPNTLYGVYKLSGEQVVKTLCREYGIEYTILRPSAVYGTRDMIIRVISKMVESSIKNNIINVNNNGSLDFTWVEDLAQYFVAAATHPDAANQIFNATRGVAREITEVAAMVSYMLKSDVSLENQDGFYPRRGRLNSDKIIQTLGHEPQVDIEHGVPAYVNWFLEQPCYRQYFDLK